MKLLTALTGYSYDTKPVLILDINNVLYLFSMPDSCDRIFVDSNYSIKRIRHFFLNSCHVDDTGGLLGTLVSILHPNKNKVEITGPTDIFNYFTSSAFFSHRLKVIQGNLKISEDDYKDDLISVKMIKIYKKQHKNNSAKNNNENQTESKRKINSEKNDNETNNENEISNENETSNENVKNNENEANDNFCVLFSIEVEGSPGKFLPAKAKSLGVKPGPDFRRLTNGETLIVDGKEVTLADCISEPLPGEKILIVNIKNKEEVECLAESNIDYNHFDIIVHLTPIEVVNLDEYKCIFPQNEKVTNICFPFSGRITYKTVSELYNKYQTLSNGFIHPLSICDHSKNFPSHFVGLFTDDSYLFNPSEKRGIVQSDQSLQGQNSKQKQQQKKTQKQKNLEKPIKKTKEDSSPKNTSSDEKNKNNEIETNKTTERKIIENEENACKANNNANVKGEKNTRNKKTANMNKNENDNNKNEKKIEKESKDIVYENYECNLPSYDSFAITFLGSGSASPSPQRADPGYLIHTKYGFIAIDIGEGYIGQLTRKYGPKNANYVLSNLICIYISHNHSDHCYGLHNLLRARALLTNKRIPLICDADVIIDAKFYESIYTKVSENNSENNNNGYFHVEFIDYSIQKNYSLFDKKINIYIFDVSHCVGSTGCLLTIDNMWHIAYSGDRQTVCRSTSADSFIEDIVNLVKLEQNEQNEQFEQNEMKRNDEVMIDLLIHEATFTSEFNNEMDDYRHSTVDHAIKVSNKLKARCTALVHVSARYEGKCVPSSSSMEYELEELRNAESEQTGEQSLASCSTDKKSLMKSNSKSIFVAFDYLDFAFDNYEEICTEINRLNSVVLEPL